MTNTHNSIENNWAYIRHWLNDGAKYADSAVLALGASEEQLEEFQLGFTIKMPSDFSTSYLLHNGFTKKMGLIHGGDLLSLDEIKHCYTNLINQKLNVKWDPDLIPFVEFNDSEFIGIHMKSNLIFRIELDLSQKTIFTYKIADSYVDFLSGYVNDLRNGNGIMGELFCE